MQAGAAFDRVDQSLSLVRRRHRTLPVCKYQSSARGNNQTFFFNLETQVRLNHVVKFQGWCS